MKHHLTAALLALLLAAPAHAHEPKAHIHGQSTTAETPVGRPGKAAEVERSVTIRMLETPDGEMLFEPSSIHVRAGVTVTLVLKNDGEADHEFILAGREELEAHKAMMQEFPDMRHEDANSLRLAPGTSGEIIWTFGRSGQVEFACLIPGHYEAGMHGKVSVADH